MNGYYVLEQVYMMEALPVFMHKPLKVSGKYVGIVESVGLEQHYSHIEMTVIIEQGYNAPEIEHYIGETVTIDGCHVGDCWDVSQSWQTYGYEMRMQIVMNDETIDKIKEYAFFSDIMGKDDKN